jgi:hypothetical protein
VDPIGHSPYQLQTFLQATEFNKDTRLCLFDIENMYINIPKSDVINIINNIFE